MNNQISVLEQNNFDNLAVSKKLDFFKTAVIVLGILIILGLFGNIYLLTRKQIPPVVQPVPTPIQTIATPTVGANTCKNETLGLSVLLPNSKWSCESSVIEGDSEVGKYGLMKILSSIFNIQIGSYMDKGIACYGDEGPNVKCEVATFFSNSLLNLRVLKHNGQEISFLGIFKDGKRAISIELKEKRVLTAEEKGELDLFLNSITEISTAAFGSADQTANWKAYTNTFAKFSLRYPENAKYTEKSFSEKEKQVILSGNFGSITINMATLDYSPGWGGGCDPKDHGPITIIGQTKDVCISETGFRGLFLESPEVAQLELSSSYNQPYTGNKETVTQILSTFKFLP